MGESPQPTFQHVSLRRVRDLCVPVTNAILKAAKSCPGNEPQFAIECDRIFNDFAREARIRWEPKGERRVICMEEGATRAGRIDRLFERVVLEYEPPGSLSRTNDSTNNRKSLEQVRDYLRGLKDEGLREDSLAGVVTDGFFFIFCRFSAGRWIAESPVETSAVSVSRFLRLLIIFYRPPLLPDPIVRAFGAASDVTTNTVAALYKTLGAPTKKITEAVFKQWGDFFADIAGLDTARLKEKKELMAFAANVVGGREPDAGRLLFALYTYSAMLIKLLAVAAVTPFFDPENPDRLSDWANLHEEQLRACLRQLESGEFYRRLHIRNFTEGDFFGWYCEEWNPVLAKQVRRVLAELSQFDPGAVEQAPERVRDLLKRLYHGLFPRPVRHDLGEYYTPDWLAEHLLARLDSDLFPTSSMSETARRKLAGRIASRLTTTRFLDPACGSGTFLVLVMRRFRQWARECGISEADKLLPALLRNVVGFDLNPLAVISARANFLLAVADLVRPDMEPIELPIYLADSIVLPADGRDLTSAGTYPLPLRGVDRIFAVPRVLARQERLPILARLLRENVEKDTGAAAFLRACEGEFSLTASEWDDCERHLRALYETLFELHRKGQNGLWADIARNMFMPLFIPKVDFVVGNPPWVNWESLPQHYRDRSKGLWEKYGLFVHGGMDTILGKGKKDISMLLTYVASDIYLKTGGKLGFVITQSVFKTSGAGQGFRRFRLGERDPLRVLVVDDFSAMQPFEGATNRTAVLVLQKGQRTSGTVPYYVWRKTGKVSVPFTASLEEAKGYLTSRQAYAEPVDSADPTSAWLTANRPALRALRKVLGKSDYRAYAGAYSGGANAVYWLQILKHNRDGTVEVRNITEGAKREIKPGVHTIEADLLYPLLRGREVKKWLVSSAGDARFLIVQDPQRRRGIPEEELRDRLPRTYRYLKKYEKELRQRKSQSLRRLMAECFYAMFAVGEYTFAPYKVAWAEVSNQLQAGVVEPQGAMPVVPDHTVIIVPFDRAEEAYYLCAILNSSPANLAIQNYIVLHPDPHVLDRVRIPRYAPRAAAHRRLAQLSRRAHAIASGQSRGSLADAEGQIDECVAEIWGLTSEELAAVQRSRTEMRPAKTDQTPRLFTEDFMVERYEPPMEKRDALP